MTDNFSKLSAKDVQKAKNDFLRKTSQVARSERTKRQDEHRANAPKAEDLSRMGAVEFERTKQKFFRSLR